MTKLKLFEYDSRPAYGSVCETWRRQGGYWVQRHQATPERDGWITSGGPSRTACHRTIVGAWASALVLLPLSWALFRLRWWPTRTVERLRTALNRTKPLVVRLPKRWAVQFHWWQRPGWYLNFNGTRSRSFGFFGYTRPCK